MKNLILLLIASVSLTACMATTDGAISTQRAVTTTGKNITSTTDATTDTTSGDKKDKNWEYDEEKTQK